MSRPDKRVYQDRVVGTIKDESVRVFAFANTRPGYQVVFSPEEPIIVLKTRRPPNGQQQHPCAQWEPFGDLVFRMHPNTTHAVYVADTTALSSKPGFDQEELVNGAAVGRTLRQLRNTVARLNPHNATLVAAGVSAHLALKYVLVGEKTLGHRDRLVEKLLLVCPSSLEELVRLTDAVARLHAAAPVDYPKPSLTVLVKGETDVVRAYQSWLDSCSVLFSTSSVESDLSPNLFAAIARRVALPGDTDEGAVDTNSRYEQPRVYRIDFILSKTSKSVEQFPVLSPLHTLGVDGEEEEEEEEEDDDDDDDDDCCCDAADTAAPPHGRGPGHTHFHGGDDESCSSCGRGEEAEDSEGESGYAFGVALLQQLKDPVRVCLEGRIVDLAAGLVGTTEGCVTVEGLAALVAADASLAKLVEEKHRKRKGSACVTLITRLLRDEYGRTTLKALEVHVMSKQEERRSMTVGTSPDEIPLSYNVSAIAHHFGAVLIRGRKCTLMRHVDGGNGTSTAMFLPHQPLSERTENGMDCAIRAFCDACDVSSDNFFCPSYLPPIVSYDQEDGGVVEGAGGAILRCTTFFIALAVSPPPRGPASDSKEDPLDPTDRYDWVSFDKALLLLTAEKERSVLREVVQALAKAREAGLYKTFDGCGYFGERVQDGDTATTSAPPRKATAEIVVVLCPGHRSLPDALEAAVQSAFSTPKVCSFKAGSGTAALEAAAEAAARDGHPAVAVFLNQEDVDVNDFCEEQLLGLLERRGLRSRLVTALTPCLCDRVADMSGDVAERAGRVNAVLAAAGVSDCLFLAEPPPLTVDGGATRPLEAEEALWAILDCCLRVNPDLTVLRGWQRGAQSITASEIQARARQPSSTSSAVTYLPMSLSEADTPLAPAALAYLTRPGSLDVFFEEGKCFLLAMEGVVHVATRPKTQGLVSLDLPNRCLEVDGGDHWGAVREKPHSTIHVSALCAADLTAVESVRATAAELFRQLLWHAERDGSEMRSLRDPLPPWE